MATITAPASIVTAGFDGSDTSPAGVLRLAAAVETHPTFDATLRLPAMTVTEWRAQLVTATGELVAEIPDAGLDDITETLNDTTTTTVTVPFLAGASALSPAASAIDNADVLPALELRVWRGDTIMHWGPITDDHPDTSSFRCSTSDPSWWLSRRHWGPLGVDALFDAVRDPATVALDGWQIARTTTVGGIPTFLTPDPAAITVTREHAMPDGSPMLKATAPTGDPDDSYQIAMHVNVTPPLKRGVRFRASAWIIIPSDGGYAPTTQNFGLFLGWVPADTVTPAGYITVPTDWAFSGIPTDRDRLVEVSCELEIPSQTDDERPTPEATLYVAWFPPQGTSYCGGLTLRGDDGRFFYDADPPSIAGWVINHAMGRDIVPTGRDQTPNLWPWAVYDRALTDRELPYEDHPVALSVVQDLAREGWFDWSVVYAGAIRILMMWAPRRGQRNTRALISLDAAGFGSVADVRRTRAWSSGATVVAAQDTGRSKHERAAKLAGAPALEEIVTASRLGKDYSLESTAEQLVRSSAQPVVLEVDTLPGDETFLHGVNVGDTVPVRCTKPGAAATGDWRIVRKVIHPTSDNCTLTLNPDPSPLTINPGVLS